MKILQQEIKILLLKSHESCADDNSASLNPVNRTCGGLNVDSAGGLKTQATCQRNPRESRCGWGA